MTARKKSDKRIIEHWQVIAIFLTIYDAFAVTFSYFFALLVRFDFKFSFIPVAYYESWLKFSPIYIAVCIAVFWFFKLYKSIWRFASFTELERIIIASIVTAILHTVLITELFRRMPISYYLGGSMLQFLLITVIRFSYRFILLLRATRAKGEADRIMIIGMHSIIGTT